MEEEKEREREREREKKKKGWGEVRREERRRRSGESGFRKLELKVWPELFRGTVETANMHKQKSHISNLD